MSYTSLFEEAAKNTAAITLLNKFRHVLQGRTGVELNQAEKNTILEALTINDPSNLSKAIIYSLQGSGNDLSGSIPSIGRAIEKALRQNTIQGNRIPYFIKDFIGKNKLSDEKNNELIKFIEVVMEIIGEKEGGPLKSPLRIKEGSF